MLWKIEKSLGSVAAVQVDSISTSGVCVEYRNYKQPNSSIIIYQDGELKDISINDYIFPCVFNHLVYYKQLGEYGYTFHFLDPLGEQREISDHRLHSFGEAEAIEKFCLTLYYISCCDSIEQYNNLYRLIINMSSSWTWNSLPDKRRELALKILNFIEEFTPKLSNIKDTEYLQGLKQKLNVKFREAREVISNSECPR